MAEELVVASSKDMDIRSRIMTIRGVQVMLDRDLALLYGVEPRVLNQAVKRNPARFPERFMHQLTKEEHENLKSQSVISSWGGDRYLPKVFTEQGVAMLSSVLHSPTAIDVSIRIMDAFVSMRRALISMAPVLSRVESTERRLLKQEDAQLRNEERFEKIFDAMNDKKFPPQKVFFDGEFFDAFVQMKKFVRQAKRTLVVIDPYFDDSCLPLIAQKRPGVVVTVVVSARGRRNLHDMDVSQFNRQYANALVVKETEKFHDRYLIIDNATLIHVGASLNHLGKKCFAFSKMGAENIPDIMARIP